MGEEVTDLARSLREMAGSGPSGTSPGGWYSREGDCVFFYNEDVPHHRDRVDDLLTVYRADEDKRIIGVQVKGIRKLPKHDLLGIMVEQGEVEVVTLLLTTFKRPAKTAAGDAEARARQYAEAIGALGKRVPTDLQTG